MTEAPTPNYATVKVVDGPLVAPVLSRVVGMLAARAQCPVDRLDDALLVADAIAAHAPRRSPDGHVTVRLSAGEDGLELRVLDLGPGGGDGLVSDASLPGVGNVLERIADDVRIEDDDLVVRLSFT